MTVYTGTPGNDTFTGTTKTDTFNDIGAGDTIDGGAGTDYITIDLSSATNNVSYDTVLASTSGGTSPIAGMMIKNIEHLTSLATGSGDDTLTISRVQTDFIWHAGAGTDTLVANYNGDTVGITAYFTGNDLHVRTYQSFSNSYVWAVGYDVEAFNLTGGNGGDDFTGGTGNDTLKGANGDDTLNGGTGVDKIDGGAGTDYWHYERAEATTAISIDIGNAATSSGIVLADGTSVKNVEVGFLTTGTGDDVLTGGSGNDFFFSGAGHDSLTGGGGNDELHGEDGNDTISAGDGYNYAYGGNGDDTITGGGDIDHLFGDDGNDSLSGGAGNDVLLGLAGDDIIDGGSGLNYLRGGDGNDTITGGDIEDAVFGDDGNDILNGGVGADSIDAGTGNDTLDGGDGADEMIGGAGDDTYTVDNGGDTAVELNGEGTDTVNSSITFSLSGIYIENLNLTGSDAINAIGSGLNNILNGNTAANTLKGFSGNDTLDGKGDADVMLGGFGDDTYWVDNAGDVVTELKDQGNDTVFSTVTFSLANSFVETLQLTGTANINATGNSKANSLIGNDGNNVLNGGYGNDSLTGGTGADTFLFGTASGADTVTDFTSSQGDVINVHAYHAQSTVIISELDGNTTFDLGGGNIITVLGATALDVATHTVW